MKKKVRLILCVLCVVAFGAMALGSGESSEKKEITSGDASEETTATDEAKTESGSGEEAKETDAVDVTIEEQVLVDQDGVKVTALEYVKDDIWGDGIKVQVENNTDKNITVSCKALIVNNYMISDLFSSEVASGKKSNETIYLSSSELKAAGIETVGQVEVYFRVYDSDSWDDIFVTDDVVIKTSEYDNMDTTPNDTGHELYNEGGIKIVGKTVDENSFWGSAILLYIENNADRNVSISVDNMSINGFMTEPYFSTTVYAGKMAIDDITVMSSDLEENGIESIDEVELEFKIYDEDSYDTIAESGPITFSTK